MLIKEANKKRIQTYQGTVIRQHRAGLNSTITVRRIAKGIGVERIFPCIVLILSRLKSYC
jgi:large subunit ribosomal protein L19